MSPGDYIDERVGGIFFLPLVLPISIERCVRKRKEREKKSCLEGKQKLKGKLGRDHKRKVSFFNTPSMHVNKCINTTYVHSILANFLRPIHESSLRGFMELPYVYRISAIGVKNVCHRRRRARRDSPMYTGVGGFGWGLHSSTHKRREGQALQKKRRRKKDTRTNQQDCQVSLMGGKEGEGRPCHTLRYTNESAQQQSDWRASATQPV